MTDQSRRAGKWDSEASTGLDRDLELISYSPSNMGDFFTAMEISEIQF